MSDPTTDRQRAIELASAAPRRLTLYYAQQIPRIYKRAKTTLRQRGKRAPDWSPWCYVPMSGVLAAIQAAGVPEKIAWQVVAPVTACTIWRATKTVLVFDRDLATALLETPPKGAIPVDVLRRLPVWCPYVTLRGLGRRGLDGFFVWLEEDANTGREELRIELVAEGTEDESKAPPRPISLILHLEEGATIESSLEAAISEAERQAWRIGETKASETLRDADAALTRLLEQQVIAPVLSLILYLCAEDRDLGSLEPIDPAQERAKRRWSAARDVQVTAVGVRLGDRLRRAQVTTGKAETGGGAGGSKAPHVRRAHWHTYWTGKGRQTPVLRWLSPILVGAEEPEVTTVRPV